MSLNRRASFTLIELLVVLAIVAILSVVVIMTLNPSELLKQARDSNRLSDLSTLNTALSAYSADVNGGFMGTSSVVYVSIPDTTSTCANLGLPTLPTGWSYNCVTSTSTKLSDGRGWIPVNFSNISFGSPLSSLPVDPINATSSRNYYTYVSGGSYELTAALEAAKNKLGGANDLVSRDGGDSVSLFETGNNRNLLPVDYGDSSLVGYWNFENDVSDHSGNANNGTWYGTSTERYATGKVGSYSGYFNGSNDYVNCGAGTSTRADAFSVSSWVKFNPLYNSPVFSWGSSFPALYMRYGGVGPLIYLGGTNFRYFSPTTPTSLADNNWHHAVFTVPGNSTSDISNSILYIDGYSQNTATTALTAGQTAKTACRLGGASSVITNGLIDEVRIYSRVLSAAEVQALYNATK